MTKECDFCVTKVSEKNAVNVKELVIDKSPGIVKFTDVLADVSLMDLSVWKKLKK